MSTEKSLEIIGNNTLIKVAGVKDVPAKIDTGADSSSIWASNIIMTPDRELEFSLFAPGSPFYTGERLRTSEFNVKQVRSSNGGVSVRYQIVLPVVIHTRCIRVKFTLADRSSNHFPVLIGRRTLQNKFLVDVSKARLRRPPALNSSTLSDELAKDPYAFHKKYMSKP